MADMFGWALVIVVFVVFGLMAVIDFFKNADDFSDDDLKPLG